MKNLSNAHQRFGGGPRGLLLGLFSLLCCAWLLAPLPGVPARAQGCTFTLTPANQNFLAGGGRGSLTVNASQPACTWTATSNAPWLTITAGAAGTGNGIVAYTVAANPGTTPRNATLTVAGQSFNVTQNANLLGLQFYPLAHPIRLLETRNNPAFPGCFKPNAPIPGGVAGIRTQPARGLCDGLTIPPNAAAITGNITTVNSGGGYLTLYPSDAAQPTVANSNYGANEILNNVFTVGLGAVDGAFKIFVTSTTDVVIDVTGYYAPPGAGGLYFHPLPTPIRLLETRNNPALPGCFKPNAPLPGGVDTPQLATGLCQGVTIPANAQAITGNATTVNAGSGYFTLYPSGAARPTVASSNYLAGQIMNAPFTVGLGVDGRFVIFPTTQTDLVVDVLGYYSPDAVDVNGMGLLFSPLAHPIRLLETRNVPGFPGCYKPNAPLAGGAIRTQPAWGLCDGLTIPAAALGLIGNATTVNPLGGYLTFWPSTAAQPIIATSNFTPGQVFNRHFTTGLGNTDGAFNIYTLTATDLVVDLSGYFAPPPANAAPAVDAGADQTIALATSANLTGTASDDGLPIGSALTTAWSKLSGPGTVTFGNANQAVTTATFSAAGVYVLRLTANDGLLTASDDVQVTVGAALAVNAGPDQVVTLPNTAMLLGSVSGGAGTVTSAWSKVSGPSSVLFSNAGAPVTTATIGVNGVYVLRLSATDTLTTVTDDVQVTVNADPTPPPTLTPPPINMTVATTIGTATEFLYTGANPIQTGVAPGTINPMRAAVLKGRVLDKNNAPLPLAKITVLDHPELGQTMSRADGRFDLAVNGGGVLTVKYEKLGFLPVQRTENVPWQDYCGVPDVVMMGYDPTVTFIDLTAATPIQVVQGSVITDSSGTRRARLFFKQGTTATIKLPGGGMQGLDKFNMRATEYTVGANGPQTMPGDLPPTSDYTYAVKFSIDEAEAVGAVEESFSQPVIQYLENFLNFPTGTLVPSGFYDSLRGVWVPSANGRVVKILSITGGAANLDVNGAGLPATDPEYAALGINVAERQTLATLYAVNQSLWRVPFSRFSPIDLNFPGGDRGQQGNSPNGSSPATGNPPNDPDCQLGSVIGCQGQTLGEAIKLVGAPFTLNYSSDRTPGRQTEYTVNIPLSGATVPAPLQRIDLEVSVAGQVFRQSFPAAPNQTTTFTWDGKDAYGRTVQGKQTAIVTVGFVYRGVYYNTVGFGFAANGIPLLTNPTRNETSLLRRTPLLIGAFDARGQGLGGWSVDVHHVYDPLGRTLYTGDGGRRRVESVNRVITTAAGTGAQSFSGDGGQATAAAFNFPFSATAAPNGELYIADSNNRRIRKVDLNGIITTVVGNGANCTPTLPCGDGVQAINAQFTFPTDTAFGPDGSLYIYDDHAFRVRKVAPGGVITTVAGNGQSCADPTSGCGDGGPATQAQLSFTAACCPGTLTVAPDGTLYLTDAGNHRIRRVGTDGIISTIAGNGRTAAAGGCTVVGGAPVIAANACVNDPRGVTTVADGSVYFTDFILHQIFRVATDGLIRVVAGDGVCGNTGDGGPAVSARLCNPHGITHEPNGTLVFSDWSNARIRRIDTNGVITNFAGTGVLGFSGDGGPSTAAQIRQSLQMAFGPDGAIYISDTNNHRIRKVFPPLPGFTNTDIAIPSTDGGELYQFNPAGRHLRTINTLTGANKYVFGYDGAGRLITVTDGDNNVTTIQRDGAGNPTGILSPFNQLTTLMLNAGGYINKITDPASQMHQFVYSANGLMTQYTTPRNQVYVYTYDSAGRLARDDDPAGGFKTLARTDAGLNYNVLLSTALNRTTNYQVNQLANGDQQRINTLPDSTQSQSIERPNGTQTFTEADGTTTNITLGPDPRWKMQAPLPASVIVSTPGNLAYNAGFALTVNLSNPSDPLSLTGFNETLSLNGRTYTNVFTAANRTSVQTSPQNRQTNSVVDSQGRLSQRQFADFNSTFYLRDARGRLQTFTFGAGADARATNFSYNGFGQLAALTDALNRSVNFTYDAAGRVIQQTLPDNRAFSYAYDSVGNITSIAPPGRPTHTFTFTSNNELASYTAPNLGASSTTLFEYNLDHQLTRVTRPDGQQMNFSYDSGGRQSALSTPSGQYAYAYAATTGQIASISAPGGGVLSFSFDGSLLTRTTWAGSIAGNVSHTYDNFFRPVSQSVNNGSSVSFTYDNDGLLTGAGNLSLTRHAQRGLLTGTNLFNVTDARSYNAFGELIGYNAGYNNSTLFNEQLAFDKLGRITQRTENINGATNIFAYAYDQTGRLTAVTLNNAANPFTTYAYDANSNRTSINVGGSVTNASYDAQDRLTQYGGATYTYSANGELQSKTSNGQTTQYDYDVIGNLRHVTLPNATQIEYVIDGLNHRIGKKINGTLMQGFLYLGQFRIIAELDGNNSVVSRFVYGSRSHVPDYMTKGNATYRLITDHLGSVRLVVDASTGAIAQRLDYDEFGVVLLDTNPGFQPFGFAGGLYDAQTKLVRCGARDYDAETGRWTAKDPTLFSRSAGNLYEYVSNDPINYLDITGFGGGGGGSSPGLPGVGSSRGGLVPDVLRAVNQNNQVDPNRSGNLAAQLKNLLRQIKADKADKAKAEQKLKELEDLLENYRRNKVCPTKKLLQDIEKQKRNIARLDRAILDDTIDYLKVAGQIDFDILADPLADYIGGVQDDVDPATWLTRGIQSLLGGN